MITKRTFTNCISAIQATTEFEDNIYNVINKHNHKYPHMYVDYSGFTPNCENELLQVLEDIFNDQDGVIGFFCYDIDFGTNWYEGCYVERNPRTGEETEIKLATVDDLWEYLNRKGDAETE